MSAIYLLLFDHYDMDHQLAFTYERPRSRRNDPASSRRAEDQIRKSGGMKRHAEIIEELVGQHPGWTAKQLGELGVLSFHQIDRRTKEMEEAGRIQRVANGSEDLRLYPV